MPNRKSIDTPNKIIKSASYNAYDLLCLAANYDMPLVIPPQNVGTCILLIANSIKVANSGLIKH